MRNKIFFNSSILIICLALILAVNKVIFLNHLLSRLANLMYNITCVFPFVIRRLKSIFHLKFICPLGTNGAFHFKTLCSILRVKSFSLNISNSSLHLKCESYFFIIRFINWYSVFKFKECLYFLSNLNKTPK